MNKLKPPLVVDLDGTLIKTDLLPESFYAMIRQNPFSIFQVPVWLLRGKAYLKEHLASRVHLDARTLPYHEDFLAYLRQESKQGRTLVLATASAKTFADSIARHLGIFAEVLGTEGDSNLKGMAKLKRLQEKYGEKGFDYAGNESADVPIFQQARHAILVNADSHTVSVTQKIASVERIFTDGGNKIQAYVKALRLYQWVKNVLLFVPLVTSHQWHDAGSVMCLIFGFLSFGMCASGGYIFNDLLDLWADRNHPRKKNRPFASGKISIWTGSFLMVALQVGGLALAAVLNINFFWVLFLYCVTSLAYTFHLKTYVLIDVLVLAGLYTLRVMAGSVLANAPLSFWFLGFSVFIFFSLALIKRCSELKTLSQTDTEYTKGRDYSVSDMDYLREMGIASGYMAILVVAFYINSPDVALLYSHPKVLWLICPILLYWISRLWLKTGRGEMTDDPIVFSIKDRGSRFVAVAALVIVLLAI